MKGIQTIDGDDVRHVYFDESRAVQDMQAAKDSNGQYKDDGYSFLDSVSDRQKWMEREDVYSKTGKQRGLEAEEERRKRLADYQPMPTNHSTLPAHHLFISRVVAYDLPIGFCDAHYVSKDFWYGLMQDADWTQMADPYYSDGLLSVPNMPSGISTATVQEDITKADLEREKWRN
jgi:hypothetical protein